MMAIMRALTKNAPLSARKGRLIADLIRGLPIGEASERLQHSRQKAGRLMAKTLRSAIANAEENHNADIDVLRVSRVEVTDGISAMRARFCGRGRVHRIRRRRSHILLELSAVESGKKARKA